MVETPLPSRTEITGYLDDWTPPIEDTPFGRTLRAYASGRLVDREAIDWDAGLEVWARWRSNAEHDDRDEPEAFVDAMRAALGEV